MEDMGDSRHVPLSSVYEEKSSYPMAHEYSTFKKVDAKEGSTSLEGKFGVADVYDNNVYNYGEEYLKTYQYNNHNITATSHQ